VSLPIWIEWFALQGFVAFGGRTWTAVANSSLARNEGVPGSSPGVGFPPQAAVDRVVVIFEEGWQRDWQVRAALDDR
jgi:hypothetical protein